MNPRFVIDMQYDDGSEVYVVYDTIENKDTFLASDIEDCRQWIKDWYQHG